APAIIALGGLEDLLVLGVAGDATFDAGHDSFSLRTLFRIAPMGGQTKALSAVGQKVLLDVVTIRLEQDVGAAELPELLIVPLDHAVRLLRVLEHHLSGRGNLEALLGAGLGLDLGHLALLLAARGGPRPPPPVICSMRAC